MVDSRCYVPSRHRGAYQVTLLCTLEVGREMKGEWMGKYFLGGDRNQGVLCITTEMYFVMIITMTLAS